MNHIQDAQIYVGTYAKYNAGSIFGKWLILSDYYDKEEFYEACRQLHADENDPEFMFQGYENIPEGLIGESWLSDNFFPLRDELENMDDNRQDAFFEWCEYDGYHIDNMDVSDVIAKFNEAYIGQYNDEEDFAQYEAEACFNIPAEILPYFDYQAFARDLFCTDYYMCDGFVFRRI